MKTETRSVKIEEKVYKRLRRLSRKTGRRMTWLVSRAVEEMVKQGG